MKSLKAQLDTSAVIARFLHWRAVRRLGEHGYVGLPPDDSPPRQVPNYFAESELAGKAEICRAVQGHDLQTKTMFVYALDRLRTGGIVMRTLTAAEMLSVDDVLDLLTAPPALVALALVEAANLENEMAIAA